jgi:hypothetical protein
LDNSKIYTIYVKVSDELYNERIVKLENIKLTTIEKPLIKLNRTTLTVENVILNVSNLKNFNLECKKTSDTAFASCQTPMTITENTSLDFRLTDGINHSEVTTIVIDNIDNGIAKYLIKAQGGVDTIIAKKSPEFSVTSTTDEGMYTASDDYGTSYYYRGAVTNNNVIFAGYCWKVIRINGNGTTRMIYNGTPTNGQCLASGLETQIGKLAFNTTYNDNAYIGYMYGTKASSTYDLTHENINSSTIKTAIDTWYNTNLINFTDKISDTEFCSDRSIADNAGTWSSNDTAKGYGKNYTVYGAYNRTVAQDLPILTCQNQHDRFTVSDKTIGNGNLTYPVGLITIDEVEMAGVNWKTNSNTKFYLYTGSYYWTMSPFHFNSTYASNFSVSNGNFNGNYVGGIRGIRPVINLKVGIPVTSGDGLKTNPFVIS